MQKQTTVKTQACDLRRDINLAKINKDKANKEAPCNAALSLAQKLQSYLKN